MSNNTRFPGLVLTARSMYTKESSFLPFPMERLIKDVDDLEAYRYVVSWERFTPNYSSFVAEMK